MSGFVLQGYLIFVYVELNFIENKLHVHLIDKKSKHYSLAESDEHNAERLLFKYLFVASYWSLYWIEWD